MNFDISTPLTLATLIFFIVFTLGGQLWVEWFKHQLELTDANPNKAIESKKRLGLATQRIIVIIFYIIVFSIGVKIIYSGISEIIKADWILGASHVVMGGFPLLFVVGHLQNDKFIISISSILLWAGFGVFGVSIVADNSVILGIFLIISSTYFVLTKILFVSRRQKEKNTSNKASQDNKIFISDIDTIKALSVVGFTTLLILGSNWVWDFSGKLPAITALVFIAIVSFFVLIFTFISIEPKRFLFNYLILLLIGTVSLPLLFGQLQITDINLAGQHFYSKDVRESLKGLFLSICFFVFLTSTLSLIAKNESIRRENKTSKKTSLKRKNKN